MGEEALAITLKHGDNSHECASEDTTKCQYLQSDSNDWPLIESVAIVDNTLVFTGTGFYTIGYTVTAEYMNFAASSVVVDSET